MIARMRFQKKRGGTGVKGQGARRWVSLESGRGALVDAGSAVDALGCIDDGDVVDGDRFVGADVGAGAASDTLGFFNGYHSYYLSKC